MDGFFKGSLLRELRFEHEITMVALAELIGVTRGAVHWWETGAEVPNFRNWIKLCRVFKVKPSVFINDELDTPDDLVENDSQQITLFDKLEELSQSNTPTK